MWHNYFYQIQQKYSMRVSLNKPLVIRLDGKNATKSRTNDFIFNYSGSFINALEETAKYFTKKYKCYSLFGSDEISFILPEPEKLLKDLDKDCDTHSNEVISLFSQYFYDYFNNNYKKEKIFWHAKCFSIPENKDISYLKYRSRTIENVLTTYFLIINDKFRSGKYNLEQKLNKCKKCIDYPSLKNIKNGILYYDGKRISLNAYCSNRTIQKDSIDIDDLFDLEA